MDVWTQFERPLDALELLEEVSAWCRSQAASTVRGRRFTYASTTPCIAWSSTYLPLCVLQSFADAKIRALAVEYLDQLDDE